MSKQEYTFNFRPMTLEKVEKLRNEVEGSINLETDFEVYERNEQEQPVKYKRKPVTVDLEVPETVANMEDSLMKSIVVDYIASYVKSNYVDQFLEIGPHEWETIKADAQSGRGGGVAKISISDATLELTAKSFASWVEEATQSKPLGERIQKVVSGKCTKSAITRYLNGCSPEVVEKIINRLEQWAEYIANSGDENADELADGYDFVHAKLTKVHRSLTTDIGDLVNEVL